MSMVEAKFHLLQIIEKVASPDSIITPELGFGERPKALDAVDMVSLFRKNSLPVVDAVMPVAVRKESVVRAERVGIDRASLGNLLFDNEAENGSRYVGHGPGINPAIALKKPENSHFSGSTSSSVSFAVSAEVALVNLNLAGERRLAFAFFDNGGTDAKVDSLGAMSVDSKLSRRSDSRNLKNEETDKSPHNPVGQSTSFDDFVGHDLTIRKVKHLY